MDNKTPEQRRLLKRLQRLQREHLRETPDERPEDVLLFTELVLDCKDAGCLAEIPLPYGEVPQTTLDRVFDKEVEHPAVLPPDEWTLTVGCRECGYVGNYGNTDVRSPTSRRGDAARYHDAAKVFRVAFQCANMRCKAPTKLYVHIESGESSELPRLLKEGFFHGVLPCGHGVLAGPRGYGEPERISTRLW